MRIIIYLYRKQADNTYLNMKQLIRLTEQDIHRIVKESVNKILNEIEFNKEVINDDDNYPYIIIHTINIMGAGDVYEETPDKLFDWFKESYKFDRKYISQLYAFIPEDYINEKYYKYLGNYFDKKFYYGTLVCPNKKYLKIHSNSLDDLANDNCSICFGLKKNKGFKLSDILKLN